MICWMQELQLNILQQSQLLQAGETAKSSGQLHQLQTKQQQLVAQLQVIVMELVDVGLAGDDECCAVGGFLILLLIMVKEGRCCSKDQQLVNSNAPYDGVGTAKS